MNNLSFVPMAWEDYLYWQSQDKKTLKRVNQILKDIIRSNFDGIGKPEPLKHHEGCWSRRIDETNRIIYSVNGENDITILSCRGHYED